MGICFSSHRNACSPWLTISVIQFWHAGAAVSSNKTGSDKAGTVYARHTVQVVMII